MKTDIQKAVNQSSNLSEPLKRNDENQKVRLVAPDGGWGWVVVVASGLGSLLAIAAVQQFGIIFRDRLNALGMNATHMTTIINVHTAVAAGTGLFNGPIFRKFSCRQVGILGTFLSFVGLLLTVFADSFLFYIINFSIFYGVGRGLVLSSCSLAVNTYFKEKRRSAVSFQLAVAGLCSIFMPQLATFLINQFGSQGTVLIFSGISLHSLACVLTFQPVEWHMRKINQITDIHLGVNLLQEEKQEKETEEKIDCGIISDPETPMFPVANDGWYGSKVSVNTQRRLSRRKSSIIENGVIQPTGNTMGSYKLQRLESVTKKIPEKISHETANGGYQKLSFSKKVAIFFDLDLLHDFTYLNLVIGLMIINFSEINFVILSPFILDDFGYNNAQVAEVMSLFALCDFVVRFAIPFVTWKTWKFGNKTLFLVGVMGMCVGRTIAAHTTSFMVVMVCFGWMGISRGIRLVFSLLIIPSYVPLERLPAAIGLQLLLSGIFTLVFGPLIGVVRSASDYIITIHFLNAFCYIAIIMWLADACYQNYNRKRKNTLGPK